VGRDRILALLGIAEEPPETPSTPTAPPPTTPSSRSENHDDRNAGTYARGEHAAARAYVYYTSPQVILGPVPDVEKTAQPAATSYGLRLPLGKNIDNGKQVFWDPVVTTPKKLTNQYVLIVGKSGAGKTQTASSFLWELSKAGVPSIIFDFQGIYLGEPHERRRKKFP